MALTLAFLQLVTTGSTLAACVGGAALGLAMELHPVTLLGLPLFMVAVLMSCERPSRALCLGVATGAALALTLSADSWVRDADAVLRQPWSLALVAGTVAAAVLIAGAGRRRWRALAVERRRVLLLAAIVASVVLEVIGASLAVGRVLTNGSPFMILLAPLAILVALGLRRATAFGRWGRAAAIAVPVVLLAGRWMATAAWWQGVATGTVSAPIYSMREAELLARHFWTRGYTLPDVQRHLRGPQGFELYSAIASFAPSADGPMERPLPDLRVDVLRAPRASTARFPPVATRWISASGRRAWSSLEPWVRIVVAVVPSPGQRAGRLVPRHRLAVPSPGGTATTSGRCRSSARRVSAGSGTADASGGAPIEIDGRRRERHVELVGLIATPWVIERVDGAYRGSLAGATSCSNAVARARSRLVLAPLPRRCS
ncbi:MAG: hypothetical protein U0802_06575 [Candidatus Binatia bacterium]